MSGTEKILDQMKREPANVRFIDLQKVREAHFGKPRNHGGSHSIFKGASKNSEFAQMQGKGLSGEESAFGNRTTGSPMALT